MWPLEPRDTIYTAEPVKPSYEDKVVLGKRTIATFSALGLTTLGFGGIYSAGYRAGQNGENIHQIHRDKTEENFGEMLAGWGELGEEINNTLPEGVKNIPSKITEQICPGIQLEVLKEDLTKAALADIQNREGIVTEDQQLAEAAAQARVNFELLLDQNESLSAAEREVLLEDYDSKTTVIEGKLDLQKITEDVYGSILQELNNRCN